MRPYSLPLIALSILLSACSGESPLFQKPPSEPQAPANPTSVEVELGVRGMQRVILKTSKGDITLELDANAAPKTVTNFVTLAKQGYYNNLTFHRVIDDFMIQGGDPKGDGTGGESAWGGTFEDEINALPMTRSAIAMANRGPNTNGSQFFIIQKTATPWLEGKHTVFGKVTEGIEVVDAIAKVPTSAGGKPLEPVTFTVEVVD